MAITDANPLRGLPFRGIASRRSVAIAALVALHATGVITLYLTEYGPYGLSVAFLSWSFLNFLWLIVIRRPLVAAAVSLAMILNIITLSQFKFSVLEMTLSFLDMLIIDADTLAFLLTIFPDLGVAVTVVVVIAICLLILLWRLDCWRVRMLPAIGGVILSLAAIAGMANLVAEEPWEPFSGANHVSNFARSGVLSVSELISHGWLESDALVRDRLKWPPIVPCRPAGKPPHIILVLDELSFDIRAAPGTKVPPGYGEHFRSFDGRARSLLVEATGGPTWYSEYNALTGLSARSYGRFMFNVTRIAAGRVERGLPQALRQCGYKTYSLYPAYGSFLSARSFQTSTGIDRFIDLKEMGATTDMQPDRFYFDQALGVIRREATGNPIFVFAYVAANHFPWTSTFRPELTPDWKNPGNTPEVDEYIRRQSMSARDYSEFLAQLAREFPQEFFLLLRFGDHQPAISAKILEPWLDSASVARRIMLSDARYFTTYYAIDAVNFSPVDVSSARERIEAPYLPLVVLETAGLPLDATFAEQKKIFERCNGLFYRCREGAEARRFNRLLIDADLIKGL